VPFARRNIEDDLEDIGSLFNGAPDLEFRAAIKALELEQSSHEAGPDGLEILVTGAPNLGEDPREDVDGRRDWWADAR